MNTVFDEELFGDLLGDMIHNVLPLFLIMFGIVAAFSMVRIVHTLIGSSGSSYSEPKPKFKPNFKKVDIKTKHENMIAYGFFIKSMEKQSFIKSLFTRWSSSTTKIGKNVYKKGYKTYQFTTDQAIYNKITNSIHKPIAEIKEETLLIQFNEAIHYSLKQLEQFSKQQRGTVDLNQEVERVINLVREIKTFTDHIDYEAQAETEKLRITSMNEILQKHHTVMEQLTLGVKVFNANNKPAAEQIKPISSVSLNKRRQNEQQKKRSTSSNNDDVLSFVNSYNFRSNNANSYNHYDNDRDSHNNHSYNDSHSSHSSDSHSYSYSDSSSSSDSSVSCD